MSPFENILNLTDPQFDVARGWQYKLSVLLRPDGFSFLVTEKGSKQVLKLGSFGISPVETLHSETKEWPMNSIGYLEELKKTGFQHISWQQVVIAITSYKISVAPEAFLQNDREHSLMAVTHTVNAIEEILTEAVFDLGPVIAVAAPKYLSEYCKMLFPGYSLHCAPAVFVKGLLREHSQLISRQVFINIQQGFIEIAVIQGLRLIYMNSFRYSAPSDVLYYVIFVLEQLGFVPSEENVTLLGDISESDIIFTQLKMYCGSLNVASQPEGVVIGETFNGIEFHRHFTLLNLALCE